MDTIIETQRIGISQTIQDDNEDETKVETTRKKPKEQVEMEEIVIR